MIGEQTCRFCGCTDLQACPEGCYWVKPGLCSACADEQANELADAALAWRDDAGREEFTEIRTIGGFPVHLDVNPATITIRDHLGVHIFGIDPEGIWIAPHYDAREFMPLFQEAR